MGNIATQAMEATRAELHIKKFPYFSITPTDENTWSMVYEEEVRVDGGVIARRTWTVKAHPDHGWPGEIEADVWRGLEHFIVEQCDAQADPVENPIIFTLSDIRRRMPGRGFSGADLERIKAALDCLKITAIVANCFFNAETNGVAELNTSLIQELNYVEKKLSDGRKILDHVEALIAPAILNNINLRYTRPLDKGYLDSQNRTTAKRLYEILGPKFYGLRNKVGEPYRVRYSRLCALLGNKRQSFLSKAKQILGASHTDLIRTGFLAKVEWYKAKGNDREWVVTYWPGPRARAEGKKEFWLVKNIPRAVVVEGDFSDLTEPVSIEDEASIAADLRQETAEEAYDREARQVFADLTGTRRRFDRQDRELLAAMRREDVTLDDIEDGIRACMAAREAFEREKQQGDHFAGLRHAGYVVPKPKLDLAPVRTLRYCEAHIWEARSARLEDEHDMGPAVRVARAADNRAVYETARDEQTEALRDRQRELLLAVRGRVTERCWERVFAQLVLVEADKDRAVFLAPNVEAARYARSSYGFMLEAETGLRVVIEPQGED